MLCFHGTTDFSADRPAAVTLGKFDGMHRGHRKLFSRILARRDEMSVIFSLNARPGEVLYTADEQKLIAQELGFDCLIQCPFVPEISGMSPDEFAGRILRDRLQTRYLAVGTDFRFGRGRSGDTAFLQRSADRYGYSLEVVEKERYGDREISSTFVREELEKGRMELVADLLGSPFFLLGTVVEGRRLGRTLGVPTINIAPPKEKLLPPFGVYMSRTRIDGVWYNGITDIGRKPTVGEFARGAETHLFGAEGDLYGKEALTELLSFSRPEIRFDSLDALRAQLTADIASGKEFFGE